MYISASAFFLYIEHSIISCPFGSLLSLFHISKYSRPCCSSLTHASTLLSIYTTFPVTCIYSCLSDLGSLPLRVCFKSHEYSALILLVYHICYYYTNVVHVSPHNKISCTYLPGRGDPGHVGVHGPVCLQTEHSHPKIRNASSMSSHHIFQRLAPRLVDGVHDVAQPALASLAASFGKSSSVKVKRYSNLPLLTPPALVSRSTSAFN
jgi:hypothetical protein